MTDSTELPITEASPASLEELFSRAPPFSIEDRRAIVAELRRMREKWESGQSAPAKRTPKGAAPVAGGLADLGLLE